ncbi:hypothetical protein LDENG_00002370 [Lucifuga dentata]|nr:hypothetical protein LDENG_00002370 [Lucifuga dentata]
MFSEDLSGCCMDTVWKPPRPRISHLQAINEKQILVVRWLTNHSASPRENNVYEIQIGRSENLTVIYNRNVSVFPVDSDEYTWTWTSVLPLECSDHSVRIRLFYNNSVSSPWSNWVTNYGAQAQNETKIFPSEQVLREGADALVCCVPPAGVHITSMAFNNENYPLISIGGRVKAIAVKKLTIPEIIFKALLFSCTDMTAQTSHVWNFISFPPQKPRNFSCLTADLTTVTCSWDPGRKRDPTDFNKQTHTLHIENFDHVPVNCIQSSCSFSALPHLEEYNVTVVVKDQLGEEKESYSFNIYDRVFPVVERDRVIPGVMNATVSWTVHGYVTQLGILCQVTTDSNSTTMLNCQSVSGLCKLKLENLYPNTHYSVRVRCSVNGKLWGDWTQTMHFTTDPLVTLDIWRRIKQLSYSHKRKVTLLWTLHIPGSATMVNIRGYTVHWSQGGRNGTLLKDRGQTHAEVSIGQGRCDFTVMAVVSVGSSVPAHITVSQIEDGKNLKMGKRFNGSPAVGFNLSWDDYDTATCGYIVEWCILENVLCNLHWMKVPEGNMLIIPAQNFKAGYRYTFNIYGCTEDGHRLLETQMGYLQEFKPLQSPSLVEPVHSTSSSVTLVWRYNEADPAHLGFITGYLVTAQESSESRTTTLLTVSVADPHRKSVSIEGLNENQEYIFYLSALTKEGPGPPASITIRTRINYSAYLVKILVPILLLLAFSAFLCSQRKMLKEVFAYPAGMNIKTVEFDSFFYETSEKLQSQTVEECVICDIEILNAPSASASPSSCSPAWVPLISHCHPQLPAEIPERSDLQKITNINNKSYFHTLEEDFSEPQVTFDEITNLKVSGCLQKSCSIIDGYISNALEV